MAKGTVQKQEATTTPQIPEDILRVYRQRTGMVEQGLPQFQKLIDAGLTGNAETILPYLKGYYAPYASAQQNAINQIRRQVPRGGAQDIAVAQMLQQGAMQKGQMTSQLMQRLLDYYAAIAGGFDPQRQIATTQKGESVTKEPFNLKLFGLMDAPIG